eukprot:SAG31_NODE_1003_length_10447_cov_3.491593_15_plen_241_part_00
MLQGNNERNATIISIEEKTELATLSRGDYLRVFGNLSAIVWPILDVPMAERTQMQLQLVHSYFEHIPFLRDIPYPLLKYEVCRFMTRTYFDHGSQVYAQGADSEAMYILGEGHIELIEEPDNYSLRAPEKRTRTVVMPGSCFGEEALQHDNNNRTATATADATGVTGQSEGRCMCAVLTLESFTKACQAVGSAAVSVLRRPPRLRSESDLRMLLHMFEDCAFFKNLKLQVLCGKVLFHEF